MDNSIFFAVVKDVLNQSYFLFKFERVLFRVFYSNFQVQRLACFECFESSGC